MTNVAIVVHSLGGSSMALAQAIQQGAADVEEADVRLLRVADLVPDDQLSANPRFGEAFATKVAPFPVATADDLTWADAIILGSGTRFGSASSSMRAFLEGAAQLWMTGALVGKVGAAFATSSTPHGGVEVTVRDLLTTLMHFGIIVVPPGYADPIYFRAGSPYGAVAQAGGMQGLAPTEDDLAAARFLGKHVTQIAGRLAPVPAGVE